MNHLLLLFETDMPTVRIMDECFSNLFADSNVVHKLVNISCIKSDDLAWADEIIFIRPCDYSSLIISKKLRKSGKTTICFWDDDVLILPKRNAVSNPLRRKLILKIISNSNLFFSSNIRIVNKYKDYSINKKGFTLDTLVSDEQLNVIPINKCHNTIKLIYAAGLNHESLFYHHIMPILPSLFNNYGDKIQLDFIGVAPKLPDNLLKFNINYYPAMPLNEYRNFMIKEQYDIGLSPLDDGEFFKSKYFNKFIEYSMVGAVGVYSNIEPYTFVVKDKVNGFLANNTPEEWEKAICEAIDNKSLRNECLLNSINLLRQDFNKNTILSKLLINIPELNNVHIEDNNRYSILNIKISYKLLKCFDLFLATMWFLKNEGLFNTIKRVIKHFKYKK